MVYSESRSNTQEDTEPDHYKNISKHAESRHGRAASMLTPSKKVSENNRYGTQITSGDDGVSKKSQQSVGKKSGCQVTFGTNSERHPRKMSRETTDEDNDMHLPYWQRKTYQAYKKIKVLHPQLETSQREYMEIKIKQ